MEIFQYNLQRSKMNQLSKDTKRTILLRAIRLEYLEILNLIGGGDISKLGYDDVCEICHRYSRGNSKVGGGTRDTASRFVKSLVGAGVTRAEMSNLFENFKTDILSTLSSQLDVLYVKKKQEKQEELEKALVMFCSKCRKKHALRDCPTDSIEIC